MSQWHYCDIFDCHLLTPVVWKGHRPVTLGHALTTQMFPYSRLYVTQYNKRYILSTCEKIEILALSNRGFNKLSNDTKFIKIKVILLEIPFTKSIFLLFSVYFANYFVNYLRMDLADKMYLLLYWVTYRMPLKRCSNVTLYPIHLSLCSDVGA